MVCSNDASSNSPRKLNNSKSELNHLVATVMFSHGITAQQGYEFFSQVGEQSPLPRNILRMQETVKSEIMSLAREVLMDNRKRHNVACRSKPGYKGDVVWTYKDDGVERRAARGPITGDGGGLTRAYNHRITGSQRCSCDPVVGKQWFC